MTADNNTLAKAPYWSALRVLTLNCWKNEGRLPERRRLIEAGVATLDAHLIFLQEVYVVDGEQPWPYIMAKRLGMQWFHAPTRRKRRNGAEGPLSTSGLGILSHVHPVRHGRQELPSSKEGGERIFQWIHFQLSEVTTVTCVNLHLCHLKGEQGDNERQEQLEAIRPFVLEWSRVGPVILAGDFNQDPAGELGDPVSKVFATPFVDAVEELGQTAPTTGLGAVPPFSSGRRVDRILLFPAASGNTAKMVARQARRVLDSADPQTGRLPSDHAGVCVDFVYSPMGVGKRIKPL